MLGNLREKKKPGKCLYVYWPAVLIVAQCINLSLSILFILLFQLRYLFHFLFLKIIELSSVLIFRENYCKKTESF